MKRIVPTITTVALVSMFPLLADTTTEKTTEVTKNADGSVTKTETTTTTFNPDARTKVVKYFDAYKSEKYGLPPAWVGQVKIKEIPIAWRMTISPGMVFKEKERAHLVAAPADLISVLPPAASGVRYYVAGSNVVAVDSEYRVMDAVQIPSIKLSVE